MKYLILFISLFLIFPTQERSPREIPNDLKKFGVSDFCEPDEILRIWRFPEGGAVFEDLIEIKRTGNKWTSTQYTYLLDEYANETKFKGLRKKKFLTLTSELIYSFVNVKLLQDNVMPPEKNQFCLCDMFLAEYRNGVQEIFFYFFIYEEGNQNTSKINLINFINKLIPE